jgi:protein-tyrosine phosphatase
LNVLFVCLGNICRSPTAHGVFAAMVERTGAGAQIRVDSAGTAAWHAGKAPDPRTTATARRRGVDLSALRARQVTGADFESFDMILAMDSANLAALQALQPATYPGHLGLLLDFAPAVGLRDVPDPYYGDGDGFERVYDLVEVACAGLLKHLQALPPAPAVYPENYTEHDR